jgi:hypothetical protein
MNRGSGILTLVIAVHFSGRFFSDMSFWRVRAILNGALLRISRNQPAIWARKIEQTSKSYGLCRHAEQPPPWSNPKKYLRRIILLDQRRNWQFQTWRQVLHHRQAATLGPTTVIAAHDSPLYAVQMYTSSGDFRLITSQLVVSGDMPERHSKTNNILVLWWTQRDVVSIDIGGMLNVGMIVASSLVQIGRVAVRKTKGM